MSPAEVRYLLTGSTDRKSVSAVLVHLAAQKLIAIQPENGDYRITLLVEEASKGIPAEEAAAMRALAEVHSFANSDSKTAREEVFFYRPARNQIFRFWQCHRGIGECSGGEGLLQQKFELFSSRICDFLFDCHGDGRAFRKFSRWCDLSYCVVYVLQLYHWDDHCGECCAGFAGRHSWAYRS